MKSTSMNSLRGVLENYDFTGFGKVADIGGGFGHLAIALLEKYPLLQAAVLDVPDVVSVAPGRVPTTDPTVPKRLEYFAGDMFKSVPPADVYIMKLVLLTGRERTEAQWNDLYRQAGREVRSITSIHDDVGTSIVEGVKHQS